MPGLGTGLEHVIPIVLRGAQTLDGRMEGDHGLGHSLAGRISIEAAVDRAALIQEVSQPARVWRGASGRER